MASLDFNIGPNGYGMVLEKMNVETGIHLDAHILRSPKRRRADATRHASEQLKKGRKIRKLVKAGFADRIQGRCCVPIWRIQ